MFSRHTCFSVIVHKVVHVILISKEKVFVLWVAKPFSLRFFSCKTKTSIHTFNKNAFFLHIKEKDRSLKLVTARILTSNMPTCPIN